VFDESTPEELAELMELSATEHAPDEALGDPNCTPTTCLCCYDGCY